MWTDQQRAVIEHERGPALVLAGAGCAKTTTLCARAGRLVERGAPPNRVLITTFARLGAADIARRLARLGVTTDVRTQTLHGLAYQAILEAPNERRAVLPPDWMVLEVVQRALRDAAAERGVLVRGRVPDGVPFPNAAFVFAEIALAKANLIWPDEWGHGSGRIVGYSTWATTRARGPLTDAAASIVGHVFGALERTAAAPEAAGFDPVEPGHDKLDRWVTFDDMLAIVARAIYREEGWVRDWRARFDYVLLDETQDNNAAQWALCEHIAADRNLMAVGDDQQSIFGFRGARPEMMREFLRLHPDARVYPLSVNFRSGQRVLDAANALLAGATDRISTEPLRRGRGPEAVGEVSISVYGDAESEARTTVDRVAAELAAGRDPDEVAVLYRLNAQKGLIELEMIRRGVPYRAPETGYFRRDEVRAAVGYLACALSPDDGEGWRRCANAPTRYLGARFFEEIPTLAAARAALARVELGRWRGARSAMMAVDEVRARLDGPGGLPGALDFILDHVAGDSKAEPGLRRFFRERAPGAESSSDSARACDTLLECAHRLLLETGGAARGAAMQLVTYAREQDRSGREERDGVRDETRRVTLSTIHKAKGLEWATVYALGWNEGLLPLRSALPAEERRLAYVCATRAKDRLHISHTRGGSLFVEEVDEALAAALGK